MLKIATVATHNDGYLPALKRICEKNKCHLNVIGFGQKWDGWDWRTNKIINYLQKCKMSDIVMLIDGFDVLVISTPEEIIEKFMILEKLQNLKPSKAALKFKILQPSNDNYEINDQVIEEELKKIGYSKEIIYSKLKELDKEGTIIMQSV